MAKPTDTKRKHTYNLANMNAAQDALLRATKLMAIIDHHVDVDQRAAIEATIKAELELVQRMISFRHAPYADE